MISQVGFPRDKPEPAPRIDLGPPPSFELAPQSIPIRTLPAALPAEPPRAPPEQPVLAALRSLLQNHPDRAMEALKQYDPATQELMMNLLPVTACLAEHGLAAVNPQEVTHLLDQMEDLDTSLRSHAPLTLTTLCFCRDFVKAFGDYDPLPADYAFRAGINGRPGETVHVYAELHNPTIKRRREFYETCLRVRLQILSAEGRVVDEWADDLQLHRRALPHDFYIRCDFEIPEKLPPGGYSLRLHLDDRLVQAPRSASRSLDFQVTAESSPLTRVRAPR
jgi:hypothetical protein